jgi:hypothetical protein
MSDISLVHVLFSTAIQLNHAMVQDKHEPAAWLYDGQCSSGIAHCALANYNQLTMKPKHDGLCVGYQSLSYPRLKYLQAPNNVACVCYYCANGASCCVINTNNNFTIVNITYWFNVDSKCTTLDVDASYCDAWPTRPPDSSRSSWMQTSPVSS